MVDMNYNTSRAQSRLRQDRVGRHRSDRRVPWPVGPRHGFGLVLLLALAAGCGQMRPGQPAPVVTIAPEAPAASVAKGSPLKFLVRAEPAPEADLTVGVTIASPGCTLTQAPKSVTIDAGKTQATLSVPTSGAGVGAEGCTVTATIAAGEGYQVGAATAASASATLMPDPETPDPETPDPEMPMQPVVTITADATTVTEGDTVSFTLTAAPPPESELTVNVEWSEEGSFLTGSRPQTVIITTSGTAMLTADTDDDGTNETDGWVKVTVVTPGQYLPGDPSEATTNIEDND